MKTIKELPPADYLRKRFSYDPETGILMHCAQGRAVGTQYRKTSPHLVCDLGPGYGMGRVHRVIWKIVTGLDPVGQIDHIDNDGGNNRWANLREATATQNRANAKGYLRRSDHSAGLPKGVSRSRSGYRAQAYANGKRFSLGTYPTAEEAAAAYAKAAVSLHGEFARFS